MSKTQIVINVSGGLVQGVACSDPTAEINVVDWDVDIGNPGVTETTYGGEILRACVTTPSAEPIHQLAGSEVEAIIEAAHQDAKFEEIVV